MTLLQLPFKFLLLALDFAVFALTFGWVGLLKKMLTTTPMRSVSVGDDPSHRVSPEYKDGLIVSPDPENIHTLFDISNVSFEKYADKKCMGAREFKGQRSAKVKEFGPTPKVCCCALCCIMFVMVRIITPPVVFLSNLSSFIRCAG